MACKGAKEVATLYTPIAISFEQNGKIIKPVNKTIVLAKAPFTMVVALKKPWHVNLTVSQTDSLVQQVKNKVPYEKLTNFGFGHALADSPFNKLNMLTIDHESFNYWFYQDEHAHRFNKASVKDGIVIGYRNIDQFFNTYSDKYEKVEDYAGKELYLVINKSKKDYKANINEALYTDYLKLVFK